MLTVALLGTTSSAQVPGSCEHGTATARLDANGVSAALYNNGNLFWDGGTTQYTVPFGSASKPLWSANVWLGGLVDGERRVTGSLFGPWEMWPGPIDDTHNPPADCSEFDKFYEVWRWEVNHLDETGEASESILNWPWQLGAPVEDGDGNPDNYDVAGGDRPAIEGDQNIWWVMNDVGGPHEDFGSTPLGIETRVLAFAVGSEQDALHYTTFYRYTLVNRSGNAIDSAFFGMFVEASLGGFGDEFVGSDSVQGIGYVYAGDDFDGGDRGYGDRPPALGFTVLESPTTVANSAGIDRVNESIKSLWPQNGAEAYGNFLGFWRDGNEITYGGSGIGGYSDTPTSFMFSGRPPEFWSEEDTNNDGARNTPASRRIEWYTGPFDLAPEQSVDVVFAIVFAQADDRFESVYKLLDAVPVVKEQFANGLPSIEVPVPSEAPQLTAPDEGVSDQPASITLTWDAVGYARQFQLQVMHADTIFLDKIIDFADRPGPDQDDPVSHQIELETDESYVWHVRGLNSRGQGPWSEPQSFDTGSKTLAGPGPLLIGASDNPAFIQVQGIGDDDACGPDARSPFGCEEVGGNNVYGSFNGQQNWTMYHQGTGPEGSIGRYAPHDFEIRVTAEGSFGYHGFTSGAAISVPLEVWDIGDVGPFGVNDTTDDQRMIPLIFSDNGGDCVFGFGEIPEDPFGLGWPVTDRVYGYYPIEGASYDDWAVQVRPIVETHPDGCPVSPAIDSASTLIDFARGRPLQRLTFMMDSTDANYRPKMVPVGNVIRFLTTQTESPQQSAPARESKVSSSVHLYWQLPPGVDSTRVQILDAAREPVVRSDQTVAGNNVLVEGLPVGEYLWRLSYGDEDWSEAWSFIVIPTTATQDDGLGLPTTLELKPAYPNPFSGETTLVFGLPESARATIQVFDLLGRLVDTVEDSEIRAGWHSRDWNPGAITSGVYFVVIESGGLRKAQPVTVVR